MTLREQIEDIEPKLGHEGIVWVPYDAVLDIIDQHECGERYETFTAADGEVSIRKHECYDRDALARALHAEDCWLAGIPECGEPTGPLFYRQADRIIAALREQDDA